MEHGQGRDSDDPEDDPKWLARLIDFFAWQYGWSKNEVLDLYPSEIPILRDIAIERMQMRDAQRAADMAHASSVPHMKERDQRKYYKNLQRIMQPPTLKKKSPKKEDIESALSQLKGKLL